MDRRIRIRTSHKGFRMSGGERSTRDGGRVAWAPTRRAAVLGLLGAVAGCSTIPGGAPIMNGQAEPPDTVSYSTVDLDEAIVGQFEISEKIPHSGRTAGPTNPRVALAPGDLLRISISEAKDGGLFAPLSTGGTIFPNVRVDHAGTISLPHAGRVQAGGLDTTTLEQRIKSRLAGKSVDPEVYVELGADRNHSVLVSGEVKTPGRFSLLEGPLSVIDGVNRSGGLIIPSHQVDAVIRRGGRVIKLPYSQVLAGANMPLYRGDELILEANYKRFNALGAITKAGQYDFLKTHQNLLDSLGQVGGLADLTANRTGVFLFRNHETWTGADGQRVSGPVVFRLDLTKPSSVFVARRFGMKPGDTIFVTNAPAVEWERIIRPLVQTVLIARTVSQLGN